MLLENNPQRIRPLHPVHNLGNGFHRVALVVTVQKMRHYFRISVGTELVSFFFQPFPQFQVILNNSIVNHCNGFRLVIMGVGIGPGSYEEMTVRAAETLKRCQVIVGYTVYVELVEAHFPDKEFLTTPMRQEVERCHLAFEKAQEGKDTAMICSGDAGVYGMGGVILELSSQYPQVEVEIVPGVTAAMSGAAVLGAPLMHDFAVKHRSRSISTYGLNWRKKIKRMHWVSFSMHP